MPAYVIVEIDIVDSAGYEEYKKLAGRDGGEVRREVRRARRQDRGARRRLETEAHRRASIRFAAARQRLVE